MGRQSSYGAGYTSPYGGRSPAWTWNPESELAWAQKGLGTTAEANEPFRQWVMDIMAGRDPQYGKGPQTGFDIPPSQTMDWINQYGVNPSAGYVDDYYGGGRAPVLGGPSVASGLKGYGREGIPRGGDVDAWLASLGEQDFGRGVGYGDQTPPMRRVPISGPEGYLPDIEALKANREMIRSATGARLGGALEMTGAGIPTEEIEKAIALAAGPIKAAGREATEGVLARLSSAGRGESGLVGQERLRGQAATQGALARSGQDITMRALETATGARVAGMGELGAIATGERAAEQAGIQNILEALKMTQTGGLSAQELALRQELGRGELALGGRRAGIEELLGMGGLGLEQKLGGAELALERELGRGELGLAERGQAWKEQIENAQLELKERLRRGEITIDQYNAETSRLTQMGQLDISAFGAGTERMGLGLDAERMIIDAMLSGRGMDIQEMLGQRGLDIEEVLGLGGLGFDFWALPQQIQAEILTTWMRGKMQPEDGGGWETAGALVGDLAQAGATVYGAGR